VLSQVQAQIEVREGPTSRCRIAALIRQALAMPVPGDQVRARLRVVAGRSVDGGRS
jgi:hypothetical protein